MSATSTSRWGPSKSKAKSETQKERVIGESADVVMAQHHSDEAASNDFELIEEVEWGPRRDEEGYDTDQELAPKPRRKATGEDFCGCFPPANSGFACVDESCILYACREECRSNCLAGPLCGNKRIQRKEFCHLEVFDAGLKGKGLRLSPHTKPAAKGDILCEYLGRAIREAALGRLFRRYQLDRRLYIMALGDGVYLDARQKGGIARYINHSCRPNCKVELWTVRGVVRAAVVAENDIAPGEELTFDYQWERRRGRAPTVCHCGMPECRGTLEVSKSLEEQDLQREFEGYWEQMPEGQVPDQTFVNRTVQIYSKEHQEYFLGEVTGYDANKGLHCIFYRQAKTEVWEDLSKEDCMILNERVDKDQFTIAKKVMMRRDSLTPMTPTLLTSVSSDLLGPGQQPQLSKNYLYVQTPIKENLWSMHLIERCERSCSVQIKPEQMARPPLPPESVEDTEKYAALDQSQDGTVWKLTITGANVPKAYEVLGKNVSFLEKKNAAEELSRSAHNTSPVTSSAAALKPMHSNGTASVDDAHEIMLPGIITDAVMRKLHTVRDQCRGVSISMSTESKSKLVSKLLLEGGTAAEINAVKEVLWTFLLDQCSILNAPMKSNRIFRDLGFVGGIVTHERLQHLFCNDGNRSMANVTVVDAKKPSESELWNRLPFVHSFESTQNCSLSIQPQGDLCASAKIYFGCKPSEVARLFSLINSRLDELARGVKFVHLGSDWVYTKLMLKNNEFFEFAKQVTGAHVSIDALTGDHLRIDGKLTERENTFSLTNKLTPNEDEKVLLAMELVLLQVECYRDVCIREYSWGFGRDWALTSLAVEENSVTATKSAVTGKLDRQSSSQCGMEMMETVAKLGLEPSVAGHAAIILYRFVHSRANFTTQVKIREAVLACIFMANKAQKACQWKRLDAILQHGYESFYPGATFDKSSAEASLLEDRVISAEREVLQALEYDIFWQNIEWIWIAALGAGKMKKEFVQTVFDFVFSGPVLGAGAELWLKYGIEYIFAASAAFLKADLDKLLFAMSLIPLKVSAAAKLLADRARYGRPSNNTFPSNPLVENISGKKKLIQYISSIEEKCAKIMATGKTADFTAEASPTENRFRIIGNDFRQVHLIRGIPRDVLFAVIPDTLERIERESCCRFFVCSGGGVNMEDLILYGSWRSVALADHLLRSKCEGSIALPLTVDISTQQLERPREQAKGSSGLLDAIDLCVSEYDSSDRRVGGKYCIPGTVSEASLQKSGLRWWISPNFGLSVTGSLPEMFKIRSDPGDRSENLVRLARSIDAKDIRFPTWTCRSTSINSERMIPISLQRWPPEKVDKKEKVGSRKSKTGTSQTGFSASALQELQVLKQLHRAIPSPQGHPNIVLPVGIAIPSHSDVPKINDSTSGSSPSLNPLLDDPILSLFQSSETVRDHEANKESTEGNAYIVFQPTPFVLNRFISRKMRSTDEAQIISDCVLAAWFHDILSALVHCHANHVLLRTVMSDQIFVDHSGVAIFGSFYRSTVIPLKARLDHNNPLTAASKSFKDRKKKDIEIDVSDNPFAAPEILLGCPNHSKESDVWAIGSLLGSLLLGKPIFNGKDRESLLVSQYKIVGTPSEGNYENAKRYPHFVKPLKKYKRGVEKALVHQLKCPSPNCEKAIGLVARMLHLDPTKRCTAVEALGHEFLSDYVENCQVASFRRQYVMDWMNLKIRMLEPSDEVRHVEHTRKRDAMIRSVSKAAGDDDDELYNMDDFLESESSKKVRFTS
jgi:serine/threonine protein kinase